MQGLEIRGVSWFVAFRIMQNEKPVFRRQEFFLDICFSGFIVLDKLGWGKVNHCQPEVATSYRVFDTEYTVYQG